MIINGGNSNKVVADTENHIHGGRYESILITYIQYIK